ncbi:FAD synthetase family protein [Neobacillus niacini]|uniref:FAD synthetase family protein n=1 Tax=Neobacillus niacini TaxID=86668 RepID=UPI0021CB68CE|nr:FAD synthetase family protein [Neobacillus niacini]MCM3767793.1 FAD synthetase family protein [Neobacillus niacini]
METIFLNPENLSFWQQQARPSVMALGFFDGIHKGHREVIGTAKQIAKENHLLLSVMTFFPHPKTVLSNGKTKVDYLIPLSEKEKLLSGLWVDIFYIVEFDRDFSSLSPEVFAAKYLINLGVVHAVAGFDYTYGFRGQGNMDRLKKDSGGTLEVTKVEKVELNGEKISSTLIRERLLKGLVEELPALLGCPYEVACEWDGESLKAKPYYTLPAPGRYKVKLNNENQTQEILVNGDNELIPLRGPIVNDVSIVWCKRIGDAPFEFRQDQGMLARLII